MRSALRLLASVRSGRYLEPGNPTGLTGLHNHPAPRSTLLYLYSTTLERLKELPEHSVYRQSTEALTKHRRSLVESVKPEGYDAWVAKLQETSQTTLNNPDAKVSRSQDLKHGPKFSIHRASFGDRDPHREWDGEYFVESKEGSRSSGENVKFSPQALERLDTSSDSMSAPSVPTNPEPSLDAAQVQELENKLEAGLLEEVILVAEGELRLVKSMLESRVWEDLQEKPPQGQWDYFARDQHQPGTQEPPVEKKS